jgi:hypothetical protein
MKYNSDGIPFDSSCLGEYQCTCLHHLSSQPCEEQNYSPGTTTGGTSTETSRKGERPVAVPGTNGSLRLAQLLYTQVVVLPFARWCSS